MKFSPTAVCRISAWPGPGGADLDLLEAQDLRSARLMHPYDTGHRYFLPAAVGRRLLRAASIAKRRRPQRDEPD